MVNGRVLPNWPIAAETSLVSWDSGCKNCSQSLLSYGLATFSYHIPSYPILKNELSV